MNDRAREALVAAALQGVRQIKGKLHDGKGGHCAYGIIHLDLHQGNEQAALECVGQLTGAPHCKLRVEYLADFEIVAANDTRGWDFLTIARKCGNEEESV